MLKNPNDIKTEIKKLTQGFLIICVITIPNDLCFNNSKISGNTYIKNIITSEII